MPSDLHVAPQQLHELQAPQSASMTQQPLRVLLADDHAGMLLGLQTLLDCEEDIEILAETCDLASSIGHLAAQQPDVLVLDLNLPDGTGVEAIGLLRERQPQTEIVVLTAEERPAVAQRALSAGACGYVTKDHADTELARAIRAAARGEQFVSPQVAALLEELHQALTGNALTPREVEVLRLIVLGHTSVEVARKLRLSPRTVETHRAHVHKKLGLATRAQLVAYALRRNLL
jgi:two-component system response regulator NreC